MSLHYYKMSKVQDNTLFYSLIRPYINFMFRRSYRRIEYVGRENIPTDGAIIYAPNHSNGLQDALAILSIDDKPKVFASRADIFEKPLMARILNGMKMVPINRIRDGYDNMKKDYETIHQAVEVLCAGVPFCIMPEGTHRSKRSLLPLGKGVFRIALSANETLAGTKPVYIVPVGLEYGHFYRFRSSLVVNIGQPINVTTYVAEHSNLTRPQLMNALRQDLTAAMHQQFWWIPDDDMYDATVESCYLPSAFSDSIHEDSFDAKHFPLYARLKHNQAVVDFVTQLRAKSPSVVEEYAHKIIDFASNRRHACIGVESLHTKNLVLSAIGRFLYALVMLPYFIVSSVVNFPIWVASCIAVNNIEDRVFCNSYRCAFMAIGLPICLAILAAVVFSYLPWHWALLILVIMLPSYYAFHDYLRQVRLLVSDVMLLIRKDLRLKLRSF